jgi:hypothetical protein
MFFVCSAFWRETFPGPREYKAAKALTDVILFDCSCRTGEPMDLEAFK